MLDILQKCFGYINDIHIAKKDTKNVDLYKQSIVSKKTTRDLSQFYNTDNKAH